MGSRAKPLSCSLRRVSEASIWGHVPIHKSCWARKERFPCGRNHEVMQTWPNQVLTTSFLAAFVVLLETGSIGLSSRFCVCIRY